MIKKLICALLLCAAQSNLCMDRRVALTVPNDGQVWHEINEMKDVAPFSNRIVVACRFPTNLRTHNPLEKNGTYYGHIRYLDPVFESTHYHLMVFEQKRNTSSTMFHLNDTFFFPTYRLLVRLLTLEEMRLVCTPESQAKQLPSLDAFIGYVNRNDYCKLDNLTPQERRNYVLNAAPNILTLCGIRAKRKSPLSVIHKDAFTIIIRQLMALETERMSTMPLQLWTPKEKLPEKKEPVKEEFRCGIQ